MNYSKFSKEALSTNRFYRNGTFLCPSTAELILQGKEDSEMFSYIEIKIKGCNLPEEECADMSEVDDTFVELTTLKSHVDFE